MQLSTPVCNTLQGMQITGVDPNPEMAPYAVDAAQAAQLDIQNLSLLQGTAEQLPVEGQSQDAVVSTLVSCLSLWASQHLLFSSCFTMACSSRLQMQ